MTKIFLDSGTSWPVPADWNNANNTVECVGPGGDGNTVGYPAGGGGGGAYSKKSNLTLSGVVPYRIDPPCGDATGFVRGYTMFGGNQLASSLVIAQGGAYGGGTGGAGGNAGAGLGDVIISGGHGGAGRLVGPGTAAAAGGGGGAGGPAGDGKKGGDASQVDPWAGGGAGGDPNNGIDGNDGDNSSAATGGAYAGTGGFHNNVDALVGGTDPVFDTDPTHWTGVGGGGGGAGMKLGAVSNAARGGNYGAGGGGGPNGRGAPGLIVITYTPLVTITIAPTTAPDGTVGTAYSQQLTASGGTPDYTYMVTSGSLPPGLTLDAMFGGIYVNPGHVFTQTSFAGLLHGTPTTAGVYSFTVRATDSVGLTGFQAYTVTIAKGDQSIYFEPLADRPLGGPFVIVASASSGLAVTLTTNTATISIAGTVVTMLSTGLATITASQAGNTNWNAATSVTRSFNIQSASTGGSGGGKVPPPKPGPRPPFKLPRGQASGDFAIALPGVAEFFAAADAAEPAPVAVEVPWSFPSFDVAPVDMGPTNNAMARAQVAIDAALAADSRQAQAVRQMAQAKQQQIAKIIAVVNFVESLNGVRT